MEHANLGTKELDMILQVSGYFDEARRDYGKYVAYVHSGIYEPYRHTEFICKVIDRAVNKRMDMFYGDKKVAKETQYIRFSLPPQHGKSMTITETLPSYFLGKFPQHGCIEVSYSDSYAAKFGAANRDKVKDSGKLLFGIDIAKDSDSKIEWHLVGPDGKKTRGGMISRGIGSGITGSSFGDLIIIDDPIKNSEEAFSELRRQAIWDEWDKSISTRIHPGAIVILIMTRWVDDDIWGRLDDPQYGIILPWQSYNLSLEAESGDVLGRSVGEPLWPEMYGHEFIRIRKGSPNTFFALYQGRPVNDKGNMIKKHWWRYWKPIGMELPPVTIRYPDGTFVNIEAEELPDYWDEQIQSWDLAFKDNRDNDFVCGGVLGRREAKYFVLDMINERLDIVQTIDAIKSMSEKHPKALRKLIEGKANGPAVIQILRNKLPGLVEVEPEGGKVARASAVSPAIESGNVYLPHPQVYTWANDIISQCAAFPKGTHDDIVDFLSQALNNLMYRNKDTLIPDKYKKGGIYSRGELRLKGLTEFQINTIIKRGEIKLIGR